MDPIDLRSDTVTYPSPEMRAAISGAPVGDDQFAEDPSVNQLQGRIAALLGQETSHLRLWPAHDPRCFLAMSIHCKSVA